MMIVMLAALMAAPVDTAATAPRSAFTGCLKQATTQAKAQKITADGFETFARAQCTAAEDALKTAVIAIDVKNGVSRKDAAENARLELEDYYVTAKGHLAN